MLLVSNYGRTLLVESGLMMLKTRLLYSKPWLLSLVPLEQGIIAKIISFGFKNS